MAAKKTAKPKARSRTRAKAKTKSGGATKPTLNPELNPELIALQIRIHDLEEQLRRERILNDRLSESLHCLALTLPGASLRSPELTATAIPMPMETRSPVAMAAMAAAAPPATALPKAKVTLIVVAVLREMTSKNVTKNSSFDEDDLGWDGLKKRAAFIPIDNILRRLGSRISGILPSDFEGLAGVPEMIDLVTKNQPAS